MAKVKMLASLIGEDAEEWSAGEVREASATFARYLIHRGAAVAVEALPPAPRLTTKTVDAADPVPLHRDPPRRRN